jgi:hypothetical protein
MYRALGDKVSRMRKMSIEGAVVSNEFTSEEREQMS